MTQEVPESESIIIDEENSLPIHIPECSCEDCIFKAIDIDPKLQVGCYLGKLDSFKKAGAQVDFVEETLSFRIDRYCKWFRDEHWAKANAGKDIYKLVDDANKIKWSAIVEISDINKLDRAIEQIVHQPIKPQSIIITTKCEAVPILLKLKKIELNSIPWVVDSVVGDETIDRGIQILLSHKSLQCSQYYVWLVDDAPIYDDFIKDIDNIINVEMFQLLAVFPKEGRHGLVVNRALHQWFYMQSKEDTILSHLQKILNNDTGKRYIKTWEQILQKK